MIIIKVPTMSHIFGIVCFLLSSWVMAEESIVNVLAGMRTKNTCIENLVGLGKASLVFVNQTTRDYTEDESMTGEFSWKAVLVSSNSLPIDVTLHCVRIRMPPMQGIEKPWLATRSELIKRY